VRPIRFARTRAEREALAVVLLEGPLLSSFSARGGPTVGKHSSQCFHHLRFVHLKAHVVDVSVIHLEARIAEVSGIALDARIERIVVLSADEFNLVIV
jgi:hypothetical protein